MSQPGTERSTEQVSRERAMGAVSDVLLTVEHALDRARRALKAVRKEASDTNAELALADAVKELERVRKRLTQDTYFAGDALRMI